jgi:hypothetical protein
MAKAYGDLAWAMVEDSKIKTASLRKFITTFPLGKATCFAC